jgi:outer membrane protein assembly factor BamB
MRNTARLMTVMVALLASSSFAADWPSIYGPTRNSKSTQKGLLRSWPETGPKLLWTVPMSVGFGGPAVSDGC